MKIVRIDCHVLLVPDYDPAECSSAQDNLVVEVHTDNGLVGIGETDTNPWVARECIRARGTHCMALGLEEMLLGADPLPVEAVWQKLYAGSKMTGRRGALICALGAIDMALWDIRGQALGVPVYQLLGGPQRSHITPYASLLPDGRTLAEYQESLLRKVRRARELGFKAAKLEVCINGPYSHNGLQEDDEAIVSMVAECREAVGPEMVLMVDVAYAWSDAKRALACCALAGAVQPIFCRDAAGYRRPGQVRLFAASSRIAAGEYGRTLISNSRTWSIVAKWTCCSPTSAAWAASPRHARFASSPPTAAD